MYDIVTGSWNVHEYDGNLWQHGKKYFWKGVGLCLEADNGRHSIRPPHTLLEMYEGQTRQSRYSVRELVIHVYDVCQVHSDERNARPVHASQKCPPRSEVIGWLGQPRESIEMIDTADMCPSQVKTRDDRAGKSRNDCGHGGVVIAGATFLGYKSNYAHRRLESRH
jgi:hypothetical protein